MATCVEIKAEAPNPVQSNESEEKKEVNVRFGIFFDGTNNNRAQVMMGRIHRSKGKLNDEDKEFIADMELDKLTESEQSEIEKSKKKFDYKEYVNAKADILEERRNVGTIARSDWLNTITLLKKVYRKTVDDIFEKVEMQEVDFTNIAILEHFYHPELYESEDYVFKIYVTGSGTYSDMSASRNLKGLGFGQGETGVLQKVFDALNAIKSKTNSFVRKGIKVNYTFDVFGFSRGATESRMFVDMCTERAERPVNIEKLINKYCGIHGIASAKKIFFPNQSSIKFNVGIYDTVASVGVKWDSKWSPDSISTAGIGVEANLYEYDETSTIFHHENVKHLGLNTVATAEEVEKVVHICALDEYRENFALCALPNGGKVEQFFMPGCHTDVGGGSTVEDCRGVQTIPLKYKSYNRLFIRPIPIRRIKENSMLEMSVPNLKEIGWIKDVSYISGKADDYKKNSDYDNADSIEITRHYVDGYSFLPLKIMVEKINVFSRIIGRKFSIPLELPQSFEEMERKWAGCSGNYGKCYFPYSKEFQDKEYTYLRQKFLHFSSSTEGIIDTATNGPNFDENYCLERILYVENGTDRLTEA